MEDAPAPGFAAKLYPSLMLLAVLWMLPSRAIGGSVREFESGMGSLRVTVVSVDPSGAADPAPSDSQPPETMPAGQPAAACLSADSIGDFASPAGICRSGDALLHIDFHDRAARRELRFPLKYSAIRRYVLQHPLDFMEGTPEERAIRLIADLAGHLRIEMRDPPGTEAKE